MSSASAQGEVGARPSHQGAPRSAPFPLAAAAGVALGAVLGGLAAAADQLPVGAGALAAILLVSGALSWGAAATACGAWCRTALTAGVVGLLVLVAATAAYYAVHVAAGTRQLDGVGTAAAVWGLAAALGGPVLGVGGWCMRRGNATSRALAWGAIGGLLASQGVYLVVFNGYVGALPVAFVAVPAAVAAAGGRRRLGLTTVVFVAVSLAAAAAWSLVQSAALR